MKDVIILGGGPAGLSAAMYCQRYGLDTILVAQTLGGMLAQNWPIENYPGVPDTRGVPLYTAMLEQAKSFGAQVLESRVQDISVDTGQEEPIFTVQAGDREIKARSLLLAVGTRRRKLGVFGEKHFGGRGVSYCATCDGFFFKDKAVGVVGGGDSALKAVMELARFASQVYVIHRRDEFRAKPAYVDLVKAKDNVNFILNSRVIGCLGKNHFEDEELLSKINSSTDPEKIGALLEDSVSLEEATVLGGIVLDKARKGNRLLKLDGLFVEIGGVPNTDFLQGFGVELDKRGFIKVDDNFATNVPGVFAAGDVTAEPDKMNQIVTAAAEGALASRSVYRYLTQERG